MKIITKDKIQKRVLKDGKPLDLDLFLWDENTRTFSSNENRLVLKFNDLDNCTFKTGNDCTFVTGSYCTFNTRAGCTFDTGYNCIFKTAAYCTFSSKTDCTFDTGIRCTFNTDSDCIFRTGLGCTFNTSDNCSFKTGSYCTFNTGHNCTFSTGSDCTFKTGSNCIFDVYSNCIFNTSSNCVTIRRDIFEVILLKENIETRTCPNKVEGYTYKKDDKYLYSKDEENEYIIVDNILSKIISRKGNVLKVQNYNEDEESYIIQDGDLYSHSETIKEATDFY